MADYDAGEVTERERQAANHQTEISKQNVRDIRYQLARQLANYDFADAQNRALADTQLQQNSRKNSADRFEAQRDLQSSALGLLGSMDTAMNGSSTWNLMNMLRSRNDKDNNTYWAQHQVNQDAVENAYNDSLNQNNVARRDAMQSAQKAIKDVEQDWRANMNNINPNLFPGMNTYVGRDSSLDPERVWNENVGRAQQNNSEISGYVLPDNRGAGNRVTGSRNNATSMHVGGARNLVRGGEGQAVGGDYFSQMMNRFNGR